MRMPSGISIMAKQGAASVTGAAAASRRVEPAASPTEAHAVSQIAKLVASLMITPAAFQARPILALVADNDGWLLKKLVGLNVEGRNA